MPSEQNKLRLLKRFQQHVADIGDSEDLIGCDGNEMLEAVMKRIAQFIENGDAVLAPPGEPFPPAPVACEGCGFTGPGAHACPGGLIPEVRDCPGLGQRHAKVLGGDRDCPACDPVKP